MSSILKDVAFYVLKMKYLNYTLTRIGTFSSLLLQRMYVII